MSEATFADWDYPAQPYPGAWPGHSYVHHPGPRAAIGRRLYPDPATISGWRVADRNSDDDQDLDDWLACHDGPPLAQRVPVLTYGSNRCPSKITWLRRELDLEGPVVVLAARTEGVAAVWASGRRARDDQRPAVLVAAPGVTERHCIWLASPEQLATLDVCEGRGERYRLARLGTGSVHTEDGGLVDRPWCYLGLSTLRRPLLVDGSPVRCADMAQADATALLGVPAEHDGLAGHDVCGTPRPEEWPAALFSYGLLQPGRDGWPLVAPHADGQPQPAEAIGAIYDTGLGWPAMLPDAQQRTPGTLTPLRDPAVLLPRLDRYEGPDYLRTRITLPKDGTVAWSYLWVGDRSALIPIG